MNPFTVAAEEAAGEGKGGYVFECKKYDYLISTYVGLCRAFRPEDIPNANGRIEWISVAKRKGEINRERFRTMDSDRTQINKQIKINLQQIQVAEKNALTTEDIEQQAELVGMYEDLAHLYGQLEELNLLTNIKTEMAQLEYLETTKLRQYQMLLQLIDAIMECNMVSIGMFPLTDPKRELKLYRFRRGLMSCNFQLFVR